jgi:hypothetical protein
LDSHLLFERKLILLIIFHMHFLADDQSVLSSLTTISTDSNTPSVVGETLQSISLSDHAQREGKLYVKVAKIIEKLRDTYFHLC